MKYTVSIEIALPRERVIQLLQHPAQRPKWLRGLVSHEPRSGVEGQVGTVSKVVFQSGRKTMELTETITRREPVDLHGIPSDRVVHYEREIVADGMWSAAREHLSETSPQSTLWVSENEYRFNGFMRLAAPLMRPFFIKQSRQVMEDFKSFAEHGTDVRKAEA
ncbi:SRPBCC family protein [Pelagibacterium sp. 26DY04]|uniref:SRPBCC family protein n=1 Tax=Pelagibacterium sp. 26DY04 TaxID=2967130 RepID=UPI002815F93B|nr:SRPBCC family protein [Pelagibacterium sp. 26DY04]WMT87805.1 SRPBCC family protein [Pelagibacterium sp. 26DY04]